MNVKISNYKDKQNKNTVKNNLSSFLCSKNEQFLIQKSMTYKYDKVINKATCHKHHDNATLHHTPTEKQHKYMP